MATKLTDQVPQYQLTEKAYIDDKLREEGEVLYFKGIPGPHMRPLNAAAQAKIDEYKHTFADPDLAFQSIQHVAAK